jgi:sec-independent protein translocase protein TatA
MTSLFAFFGAPWEMMVILVVVLLLFGNRLPSVMRSLGKGVNEFKKGIEGVDDDGESAGKKIEPPKTDEPPVKA